jgi:TonB family protein
MFGGSLSITIIIILLFSAFEISAQKKDKVELNLRLQQPKVAAKCQDLKLGSIVQMPSPKYPPDAKTKKIGGTVEVMVKVDESGKVLEVLSISGNIALHGTAIEAALKAKFSPTYCDGKAVIITGLLLYNFIPFSPNEKYFTPEKIEDFLDVTKESQFYESILDLTENYRISYGYGDRRFYPNAPLTRGDFAHFLRLTLDLLQKRAEISNINPREIGLFNYYNPQNLTTPDQIKDLNFDDPFSNSVKTLVLTYNIAIVSQNNEFEGKLVLTNGELNTFWKAIFGEDTVPINFQNSEVSQKIISRGEFALFLQESLRILTYKLLP